MRVIRNILILIVSLVVANNIQAQNKSQVEKRVLRLKEALQLTDEQTAKITDILAKEEQQTTQTQSSKPVNKRTMMKETRLRMAASDKEIEALLTPEQLKKYESYKKERMNQLKNSSKGKKFKEE